MDVAEVKSVAQSQTNHPWLLMRSRSMMISPSVASRPRSRSAHHALRGAVALTVGFALAACGSNDAGNAGGAGGAVNGGTLILAAPGDADNLFPPYVIEQNGRIVQDLVFDRLARISADNSVIGDKGFSPELAEKWTWASDSMSIAFSINPKARWHDGKPVTAADVRYSFNITTDPKVASPNVNGLATLDSISVRDSLTAVAWYKKRSPTQFYNLAYQLIVLPEHVYGAIPPQELRTSDLTRKPIGSGRFRFVRWDAGQRIELVADTTNFRGRAKLDRVILLAVSDPAAGVTQILSGQADVMDAFPIDQAARLDSNQFAKPVVVPLVTYAFMGMRALARKSSTTPHPILGDLRVRRALSMAVDRQAMLRNVFGAFGHLSHGPFSMALPFADSSTKMFGYDTVAAKALLDSAGWRVGANGIRAKNGVPMRFSVLVPATSLPRRSYAVLIQGAFQKIGVQLDIDQLDIKALLARRSVGDFDAIFDAFMPDPDAGGARQNWATSGIGPTGQNPLQYSNKTVDALLDSAAASGDLAKVKAIMLRAHQHIIDDAPAIWLYDYTSVLAVNRRFDYPPMRGDGWFTTLPDWTVPPAKRVDRDRIGLAPAKP
jgi:peptide/nickel transport system substrate-binding protein